MTSKPQEGSSHVITEPVNIIQGELGPYLSWIRPQANPRDLGSKFLLNHPAQSMETLSPSPAPSFLRSDLCSPPLILHPPAWPESGEFLRHLILCLLQAFAQAVPSTWYALCLFARPHQDDASLWFKLQFNYHFPWEVGRSGPQENSGPHVLLVCNSKHS